MQPHLFSLLDIQYKDVSVILFCQGPVKITDIKIKSESSKIVEVSGIATVSYVAHWVNFCKLIWRKSAVKRFTVKSVLVFSELRVSPTFGRTSLSRDNINLSLIWKKHISYIQWHQRLCKWKNTYNFYSPHNRKNIFYA